MSQTLVSGDAQLLQEAAEGSTELRRRIGEVIVGQDAVVRQLLAAVYASGHCLLIGVPGLAKTLLVRTVSSALGWSFRRIQFTPDMMPADIIGMELLQIDEATGRREWHFSHGPIFANLVLADEINRTPPKTQAALLEAMQELTVTSMGRTHRLEEPFVVIATQNPIEQEGTYPLPEAQLDRFMFCLNVEYPSVDEEEAIVSGTTGDRVVQIEPIHTRQRMQEFQKLVRRVPAAPHVVRYAVALARATRPGDASAPRLVQDYVEWGAGPRAGQNLILAAKALAVLDGEPATSIAHVREAALPVLRHRILMNFAAAGDGWTSDGIVKELLERVPEAAGL